MTAHNILSKSIGSKPRGHGGGTRALGQREWHGPHAAQKDSKGAKSVCFTGTAGDDFCLLHSMCMQVTTAAATAAPALQNATAAVRETVHNHRSDIFRRWRCKFPFLMVCRCRVSH